MTLDLDARLAFAREVTREAGRLARAHFERRLELAIEAKGLQDLVSEADRAVEALIRRRLAERFPADGVLGEEEGGALAPALWVIDPIDGTANFLRGLPYWGTVVAFAVDGEAELGLTHDPVHDELFWARRGHGAFRDEVPIRVSDRPPESACVGLSYSFKTPAGAYRDLVAGLLEARLDHRRMGSSALSLCHVADGRLEALACLSCNSWDVLAGLLLVAEAGGRATRYTADGFTLLDRRAVLASAPQLEGLVSRASGLALS
jgi:myo-inositol-1(or 4)-monophosphatase